MRGWLKEDGSLRPIIKNGVGIQGLCTVVKGDLYHLEEDSIVTGLVEMKGKDSRPDFAGFLWIGLWRLQSICKKMDVGAGGLHILHLKPGCQL